LRSFSEICDFSLGEKPWSEWSTDNKILHSKTGLDKEEVELIFTLCKHELANFHGRKRSRHAPGMNVQKKFLSRHNLLLLGLHSLWKNPTEVELSYTFKTPQQTICDTKQRVFTILQNHVSHFVQIPETPPITFESGPLKGVTFIVDTTSTPIPKPESKSDCKLYYNYKKRPTKFGMKSQIAVGLDLKIWNVSKTKPNSVHDTKVFQGSDMAAYISGKRKPLGDSAYQGQPHFIVPIKQQKGKKLNKKEKLFNKQVSHVRIIVENVFKRIKDYRIISDIYRGNYHNLDEFNSMFKVVCSLVNLHFQRHPLYEYQSKIKKLPKS